MTESEKQFLFLLKTALNNSIAPDGYQFDVSRVFSLAAKHNLIPLFYKAVAPVCNESHIFKNTVIRQCGFQIEKNENFRLLYNKLCNDGIVPVIVKGPVCAECYPDSSLRLSSDFDIVVKEADFTALHTFLISHGFTAKDGSYMSADSVLYFEVSTRFGEGDDYYAEKADIYLNECLDRYVISDGYATLPHNEHLIYLFYHAFKHFIGSGFGVKQIADIFLYIKHYNKQLDFNIISEALIDMGIKSFADNVIKFISVVFEYSCPLADAADEAHLCLEEFTADILEAGVFGKSSEDRLHSATVVLNAVHGEGKPNILKSLFPSFSYMSGRFIILKKFPILLPIFWVVRIFIYLFSASERKRNVSPVNSIRIANDRIELMKKMGIIKSGA